MKFKHYLKDNTINIFICILTNIIIYITLYLITSNNFILYLILLINIISMLVILLFNYYKTNRRYNNINLNLLDLDKKFLINELLDKPINNEEELLHNILYDINKSYNDYLNTHINKINDYKEYIELWVHEIKVPIASAKLLLENSNYTNNKLEDELDRIDTLVEQTLFYIKSETVDKDYMIKEYNLRSIVNKVIATNRRSFIYSKIKLDLNNLDYNIKSDEKWLSFIITQILINSIKYCSDNASIEIFAKEDKHCIILSIRDNGIGIKSSELSRVFDKGFTGSNGRKQYKSTGIGLYLCNTLCNKLHHKLTIDSKLNEYTQVNIIFPLYKEYM